MKKIVGLDFDNTIICYDDVFYKIALKKKLININVSKNKEDVKKFIIKNSSEKVWTKLQGDVYGSKIHIAKPHRKVKTTIKNLVKKGYLVYIISHKTKYPYVGRKIDLHKSALNWLKKNKFISSKLILKKNIFFLGTINQKIKKIQTLKCDYFIDDLQKILDLLPQEIHKIHFNSSIIPKFKKSNNFFNNWNDINNHFELLIKLERLNLKNNFNNFHLSKLKILYSGRNSEVREIKVKNKIYVIKKYLSKSRMIRDIKFIFYLKKINFNHCSNLMFTDFKINLAIFNYIEGKKINNINKIDLINSIFFIKKINKEYSFKKTYFSNAIDGCVCPNDHLKNLNSRILSLLKYRSKDNYFYEYNSFVNKFVIKTFKHIKIKFLKNIPQNLRFKTLSKKDLIVSPSDFGFHNIIKNKKNYYFLDFEYSGFDDPLKLLCDFICNPEYNLSNIQIKFFMNQFIKENPNINIDKRLFQIYLPIYRLKWICIILKDFTKERIDVINSKKILNIQLTKAISYYKRYCS